MSDDDIYVVDRTIYVGWIRKLGDKKWEHAVESTDWTECWRLLLDAPKPQHSDTIVTLKGRKP